MDNTKIPGIFEQHATRAAFFIAGFGMAAWAPLIPYAKMRLGLDEHTLGFLLLCFGLGSIFAMPISGLLAARFGCRIILSIASFLVCLTLPFLTIIHTFWVMATALFVFGGAVGVIDVVINIQAIIVEKASGRTLMSGFHGFFSVGGLVGSGGVGALLSIGFSPLLATVCVIAVIVLLLFLFYSSFLPYGSEEEAPLFVTPKGIVLFIGLLCFITFLVEAAMLDWSAVFLTEVRHVSPEYAGFGYTAFSLTMAFGRLTGDRIVRKIGSAKILIMGGGCVIFGLLLTVYSSFPVITFSGFAMIGLGASNIVPVFYSAAGNQKTMPVHLAVVAISCLGYAGILVGPALIGFVAGTFSLPAAFVFLAVMMFTIPLSYRVANTGK